MNLEITQRVNGALHQLVIDTRTTLLDALLDSPAPRKAVTTGSVGLVPSCSTGTSSWGWAIFNIATNADVGTIDVAWIMESSAPQRKPYPGRDRVGPPDKRGSVSQS